MDNGTRTKLYCSSVENSARKTTKNRDRQSKMMERKAMAIEDMMNY